MKVTLENIIDKWNENADEYNCWDELDEHEKVEFAYELGISEWQPENEGITNG